MGKLKKRRGKVDEDPSETKINDYLYDNIKKLYVSHIPMDSVKELPMIYKLWAGSLAYAIFIGLFVYFVSVSYNNAVDQPFMSLQGGPNCGSVPALITGSYQADVEGYWIGTADFDYVYAIYDIGLGFFNQGQVGYQNGMAIFLSSIQAVSALAVKQDLAHNLLYWMNYHITLRFDSQSEMYFQFTGTPQQVFDLEYFHGQVSNVKGICQVDADVAYDYPTSSLTMDYNYQSFSKGANCEQSLSPFLTGYYPALDGTSFQIDLDMNSFTTAVSLNLGILDLNLMQPVPGKDYTVSFYGLNVTFTEFYDSRTPNMESVVCISHTVLASPSSTHGPTATQARIMNETLCFLKIGSAGIAIPVFNHVGASFASPIPCSCSTGVGLQQSCQEFNLMPSLLFYNVPLNSSVLSISAADTIAEFELFRLLVLINSTATYAELNAKAFNVSFSTIATVYPGTLFNTINKTT